MSAPGFLIAAASVFLATLVAQTGGDTVKLADRPAFEEVAVTGFRDDRLLFRGVSGQTLRKPIAEIEWFTCASRPLLTDAERHRAADRGRAINMYERALRQEESAEWRRLIRIRLCETLDEAGLFDRAVETYLDLLRENAASDLPRPSHAGRPGSPRNAAAEKLLEAALRDRSLIDRQPELQRMRLDLLLIDGRLPNTAAAPGVATATAPSARRRMFARRSPLETDDVRVSADSLVFAAARRWLDERQAQTAAEVLRRALPRCGPQARPVAEFLLIRATADPAAPLVTAEALIRLAREADDASLVAEIWYHAGLAYVRAGRTAAARELWSAAAERARTPLEWRRKLREALEETRPE